MLARIHNLADAQQALHETDAELEVAGSGLAMPIEEAAELVQERTLRTAQELKEGAKEIGVPDALKGIQEAVNGLQGFEQATVESEPFLWTPKPTALQSTEAMSKGALWPTETYGVAGWNITWRNCNLGALSLFMFKNGGELREGALQVAAVPLGTPASRRSKESLVDSMLREGSENVRRMALGGTLTYAKPIHDQMAALAERTRRNYSSITREDELTGRYETAALYYMGVILFDKELHQDPTRQLRVLSLLYTGKYQQLAEELGVEEWSVDGASAERSWRQQRSGSRKRFDKLYAPAYQSSTVQGEQYIRMYGPLTDAFDTGHIRSLIKDEQVFSAESHDSAAWQFSARPWLYRSQEGGAAAQAAFELPSPEARRWALGRRAVGGTVGKHSIAISADNAAHAQSAHKQIQDLVSAHYVDQLGA